MKKKVLIVTLNDYIIYQPTILNLYDHLSPDFDVEIISFQPSYVTKIKDTTRKITYLRPSPITSFLLGKMDFLFSKFEKIIKVFRKEYHYTYKYYNVYLPSVLKKWLVNKVKDPGIVIAVDLPALKVAQEVFGPVHFLSLEIGNKDSANFSRIQVDRIISVLIQSRDRLDYLFPGKTLQAFIVQNAPVFNPGQVFYGERKDLIYAGTARAVFGIMECIEFIQKYPQFRLVQKGGGEKKIIERIRTQYADLIRENRLQLDSSYLPAEKFISFLSNFRIGFCFYSWDWIEKYFNYRTAPSGKLFMYMAAGIPVIACDIPGFAIVSKYKAGILIRDYLPETIHQAVMEIEKDFESYSANCYRMAADLSFDRAIQPYIEFLRKSSSDNFNMRKGENKFTT